MRRPEIKTVTITPKPANAKQNIKIIVDVEDAVIPTAEPKMYMLAFTLGSNQGGGF